VNACVSALWSRFSARVDALLMPLGACHFDVHALVAELSGFTGSAGALFLGKDQGALWTDSRYTTQAKEQLQEGFVLAKFSQDFPLNGVHTVGMDSRSVSLASWKYWENILNKQGMQLVDADIFLKKKDVGAKNWVPHLPQETEGKLKKIEEWIANRKDIFGLCIADQEVLSWLFGIRCPGDFVPACPLTALLISNEEKIIFVHKSNKKQAKALLKDVCVEDEDCFQEHVERCSNQGRWLMSAEEVKASQAFCFSEKIACYETAPWALWKAMKSASELEHMREAHKKEGSVLIQYIKQLRPKCWSEIEGVKKIEDLRKKVSSYWGASFSTISAFGAHSAIVHYSPDSKSPLIEEGPYLLDTGAHYNGGTTDMTRTFYMGSPSIEFKRAYTYILKAHIALADTVFPVGTRGSQLDGVVRQVLWREAMDYGHGTGHGVGAGLNVHEAPPNISPVSQTPLLDGMVVSIEPGYYQEGVWGLRLENLYEVRMYKGREGFLCFYPLTCVPFDVQLMSIDLLTLAEKQWINGYHAFVYDALSGRLEPEDLLWLRGVTQDLPHF